MYNFTSGVNFCRGIFCGNFFAGTFLVDSVQKKKNEKKLQKLEPTKI